MAPEGGRKKARTVAGLGNEWGALALLALQVRRFWGHLFGMRLVSGCLNADRCGSGEALHGIFQRSERAGEQGRVVRACNFDDA